MQNNAQNDTTVTSSSFGSLLVDQLACVGGGDLNLGSNVSFSAGISQGIWSEVYYQSDTSKNNTVTTLKNGVLSVNYTVEMVESWGGYVGFDHLAPGSAYYNLSQATGLLIDYHITKPASVADRGIFRLVLNDASHCEVECDSDIYLNERHYSFHSILSDDAATSSWGQLGVPLSSSTEPDDSFWFTGWSGLVGNEELDKSTLKGMTLEIVLDSQLEQGSLVLGGVAFSNFTAVWMPQDSNGWNEDGRCVFEAGLMSISKESAPHYNWIQYLGREEKCCELCEKDPECLYFFTDYWDCYLASYIDSTYLTVKDTEEELRWETSYWVDDAIKRGDFCDRCECRQDDLTIDCRGRNLAIVPKTFRETGWAPRVLDLRGNPRLSILGTGALSSIAGSLEEIFLPLNMKHISPWSPSELPYLVSVHVEDKELDVADAGTATGGLNFIKGPSEFFGDVCCGIGDHIELAAPSDGLSFCDMVVSTLGADTLYLNFTYYPFAKPFKRIESSSPFLAEAAESAEKCAEICGLFKECMVFEFDDRLPNAFPTCMLLEDEGDGATEVCCDDEHYADENKTLPGMISGRPPRTRNGFDNARVLISSNQLTVNKENGYKTKFEVSLGSTPLRGAVWIDPVLVSEPSLDVSISPSRVALYNSNTTLSVNVEVSNVNSGSKTATLVIQNKIEACDVAFTTSLNDGYSSDNTVFVEVVPTEEDKVNLAVAVTVPIVVVVVIMLSMLLYLEDKRRKNDSVWKVRKDELKFGDPPEILGRGTFGLVLSAEYCGTGVAVKRVIPPRATRQTNCDLLHEPSFDLMDEPDHSDLSKFGTSSWAGSALSRPKRDSGTTNVCSLSQGKLDSLASTMPSGVSVFGDPRRRSITKNEPARWRKLKNDFIKEMRYITKLRHPCVTTVMGAVIDKNVEPMLVMECMDHGSLYDLLHNETVMLDGEILLPMMRDIAQGMRFLHSADPQVTHGDLKAANILVDSKFRAKVADFGLSLKRHMGAIGTPYWMAPELLRGESKNTTASDVYSFGIILYEVYARLEPYEGEDPVEVLRLVADSSVNKRPPVPLACPACVQSLMLDCIGEEPKQRPTFEELDKRLRRVDAKGVEPDRNDKKFGRKSRSSISLDDIFPKHIAKALKEGRAIEPEHRDMVTVFFSDIVGFTNLSSMLHATRVADMLDRLYLKFDDLSQKHDVFKIETIGDCYIVATNLVKDQPDDHVKRIAAFAVDAIAAAKSTLVEVDDPEKGYVKIRVGFHSGPVVADVVGNRNPKYCILGDTVNTASRMESNSDVYRIHCSDRSAELLRQQNPGMPLEPRGLIPVKGKGEMYTFWVNEGKDLFIPSIRGEKSEVKEAHPENQDPQSDGNSGADSQEDVQIQPEPEDMVEDGILSS